ncbi:hypothetical protein [Liquorilactobacillus vini]|uniref:DNA-directed RNA polymerase beta subunit n=1 Tax=Liquorilactobacillus vini DSM 20605 TaxID=1133569 RepID=A0A0R2C3X5_9LACO|nr:hypothetical protein [Liquorilactobacillus vini]KRM86312.1 hypothetical protein FD21_GL001667 [Liquorilactobacillus vini DSM 20605]
MKIRRITEVEAEFFLKNYYQDRGMLKWQGFFLSDHTEALKKAANQQAPSYLPKQNQETIADLLKFSWLSKRKILVQLDQYQTKGKGIIEYIGLVKGYNENSIILDTGDLQVSFDLEDIRGCKTI